MIEDKKIAILLWCLGGALMTHAVSYFAVAYFDQNVLFWYLLLAMMSLTDEKLPVKTKYIKEA